MTSARLDFSPSLLTLGTVQLGMAYGIANQGGQPTTGQADAILDTAVRDGVTTFDTARAYGSSEAVIGSWMARRDAAHGIGIVTKLSPIPEGAPNTRKDAVDASLRASRKALGRATIDLVLAHREADLLDDAVASALNEARERGEIGGFGASVYSIETARRLIDIEHIRALQVPMSAADRRFDTSGIVGRANDRGLVVFARSVFLQGALLMAPDLLPPHLAPLGPRLSQARAIAEARGRPLSEALMLAVRDTPGVTSLVVGVDRADQLAPHCRSIRAAPLGQDAASTLIACFEGLSDDVIDPSRWPR